MKEFFYQKNLTNALKTRKFLVFVAVCLLIANVMLSLKSFFNYDRVVFVPPSFKESLWVESSSASISYLHEMASYLAHLMLDVSVSHMEFQHELLRKYIAPEAVEYVQTSLMTDQKKYKQDNLASLFFPSQLHVDPLKKTIHLTGEFKVYAGTTQVQGVRKHFLMHYRIQQGQFYMTSFKEKGEG